MLSSNRHEIKSGFSQFWIPTYCFAVLLCHLYPDRWLNFYTNTRYEGSFNILINTSSPMSLICSSISGFVSMQITLGYCYSLWSQCKRLISDDVSNLLKGALKENGYLHEHKKKNWLSSLYFLFEYLNISKTSISNDKLTSVAKSKLI